MSAIEDDGYVTVYGLTPSLCDHEVNLWRCMRPIGHKEQCRYSRLFDRTLGRFITHMLFG